jgi:type VI protein secretion system component VasF
MAKLRVSRRHSNWWFYGLLVVFVVAGYVFLQFVLYSNTNCTGHRAWEWKVPPGFVCAPGA